MTHRVLWVSKGRVFDWVVVDEFFQRAHAATAIQIDMVKHLERTLGEKESERLTLCIFEG